MMVTVTGYSTGELLLALILTYVAMIAVAIAYYMKIVMDREEFGEGKSWKVWAVLGGGLVVLTVLYQFPVRIGTITFIFGVLVSWVCVDVRSVLSRWVPFKFSKEKVEKLLAGDAHG
jgi:hypothetical protein